MNDWPPPARPPPAPAAGMFLWVDAGVDTNALTARAMQQDLLLAPGSSD
mgnify:CR=1 FL=1